jgi:lipopolysaccharide export LptBFGC system permease protein LptF
MFTTKLLNFGAAFALVAFGVLVASIEPALAVPAVPGPIIGAGLPALAILGGGYWLIRKLRG